jgi:hypothetical protein
MMAALEKKFQASIEANVHTHLVFKHESSLAQAQEIKE